MHIIFEMLAREDVGEGNKLLRVNFSMEYGIWKEIRKLLQVKFFFHIM